jgi:hypothetical protein
MPSASVELKDVFDLSAVTADRLAAVEDAKSLRTLRDELSKRAPGVPWHAARAAIRGTMGDLLDGTVPELAAATWAKYHSLRKYADSKKYAPTERILVPLVTHTIRSVHKPRVEMLLGDEPVGGVEFEIELEFTVEGALLTIRGGRIVEMRVGSCRGKGTLSCAGIVIEERETQPWLLPGVIPLGEGIPLAPSDSGAAGGRGDER